MYAAELGYRYSGDEYWQTFEEQTPGWRAFGDRQWLRTCYRTFQKTYGGAQPSGPWATQFSIICWPITHAILPRDLQRQLAQTVYELRDRFSAELFDDPTRLGEFIRARSWNTTSRFQQLVEDPPLVGQIAAALLLQGKFGTSELIDERTLLRIGNDLDEERRARDWLRGARNVAQERAQMRGFGPGGGWHAPINGHEGTFGNVERARAEVSDLGIEPQVLLRPKAEGGRWDVVLEAPDLSHLLSRFPEARDVLAGSRCVVAGSGGRPLARASCLHGVQRVRLTRWPDPGEVLLQFEGQSAHLEYLLRTECLLRPGPLWLFRIASDGLAYELRGQRLRPGQRYIAVWTGTTTRVGHYFPAADLDCANIHAALIEVPKTVSREWEDDLRGLGLGVVKTIEAWPAGLDAVAWDGEGHGEWFASERPCLAIRVDHHVYELFAALDEHRLKVDLSAAKPGAPIFVQLPQLPVGHHTMRLSARATASSETERLGELDVVIRQREVPAWLGVSPHGPLRVDIDPPNPPLEAVWDGRADISVRGPEGHAVRCSFTLRNKGAVVGSPKHLPPILLPITPDHWRQHFETHIRQSESLSRAYDTADTCEIRFDGDELGAFEISCERTFTPLRWAVEGSGQRRFVRVIDDSGEEEPLQVVRIAFEAPTIEVVLDDLSRYEVTSAGGLYISRRASESAAVIVSPGTQGKRFDVFQCSPKIELRGRSPQDVVALVRTYGTWARARTPGNPIGMAWRRDVLRALTREMFHIIGGDAWAQAELSAAAPFDKLKQSVSKKPDERNLAAGLFRLHEELAQKSCEQRVHRLAESITTFRLLPHVAGTSLRRVGGAILRDRPPNDADARWLAGLALRLASAPSSAEEWAGSGFDTGLAKLMEIPTIARAARFLVLVIDWDSNASATLKAPYAGWEWQ